MGLQRHRCMVHRGIIKEMVENFDRRTLLRDMKQFMGSLR